MTAKAKVRGTQYSLAVVTVLDVLGFGDLVRKGESPEKILELYQVLRRVGGFDKMDRKLFGQGFVNFSDTCVRITPILDRRGSPNAFGILFHEIYALMFLQIRLIEEDAPLIRGAVTIGEIFHRGPTIFGPALVRAHTLESEVATYPRVILDPLLIEVYKTTPTLKASHHTVKDDTGYVSKCVRRSDDGAWFIDYLRGVESEADDAEEYLSFLKLHKAFILRRASRAKELTRVSSKYSWLATYHNAVVRQLDKRAIARFGVNQKQLLINPRQLPIIPNLGS